MNIKNFFHNLVCHILIIGFLYSFLFVNSDLFDLLAKENNVRQVIDQTGRTIALPKEPMRIIALAPSITEIIFALNQENRLQGVAQFSDFPKEAQKLPVVGSYISPNLEIITGLKPDLCIAIKDGNPKDAIERLEDLKIPVYAVDPKDLNTVMKSILEIGLILNADLKAKQIVDDMQTRINKVINKIADLTKSSKYAPKIFFQIGTSPIVSIGTNTFINELITLAGGENIAKGEAIYPRFSIEQVLNLNPDIIIITSMTRGEIFERIKAQWCEWDKINAVKNKQIFLVDSNLFDRPSPRLVDALEELAKIIHPESFKN